MSYLTNNLIYFVQFNGHSSSNHSILCEVPQGSVLGPLLFLLYINDLNNVSKLIDLVLFADDSISQRPGRFSLKYFELCA